MNYYTREFVTTLNEKLAGRKIRRVELTGDGNLNFITDDADGDAVEPKIAPMNLYQIASAIAWNLSQISNDEKVLAEAARLQKAVDEASYEEINAGVDMGAKSLHDRFYRNQPDGSF